jgi:hypothetical protein
MESADLEETRFVGLWRGDDLVRIELSPASVYTEVEVKRFAVQIELSGSTNLQGSENLDKEIKDLMLRKVGVESWHTNLPVPISLRGECELEITFVDGTKLVADAEKVDTAFSRSLGSEKIIDS